MDYVYTEEVDDIIFITEEGKEESVLNLLVEQYPADNYYSKSFDGTWAKKHNIALFAKMLPINVGISLLLLLLLLILKKHVAKSDLESIKDYSYYFASKDKVKRQYELSSILITLITVAMIVVIGTLVAGNFVASKTLLTIIDSIIIVVGIAVYIKRTVKGLKIC